MSGSGWEALPDVDSCREALPILREWSVGPQGCLGGPPKSPRLGRRPSHMSGSGREALPDVRGGREALPDVREWWKALPNVREWSGGPHG